MARQPLVLGTQPDDGTGDTLRDAGIKINSNFLELYTFDQGLADVAQSGDYTDLTNRPNFASVATSGSYNDLLNKPSAPLLTLVKTITASYSPVTGDHGYYIRVNNTSTVTITLADDATANIPVGTTFVVGAINTGTVTFAAGGSATVGSVAGLMNITDQWGKVTVLKTAANTWEIAGQLS